MKTIRWGMIGCGDVAEVKSGPGFYKADHSSLVAVMRQRRACRGLRATPGHCTLDRRCRVDHPDARHRCGIYRDPEQFARAPQIGDGDAVPWRVDPARSGGGFFFEAVCHTFDFLSASGAACYSRPRSRCRSGFFVTIKRRSFPLAIRRTCTSL
jgi:predicted dehydrogenase